MQSHFQSAIFNVSIMANNGENGNNFPPGFRSVKSPPPTFRPPPPVAPPPQAPASPMTQRKLSINAPFNKQSPGPSPNPPPGGFPGNKRPIEKMEDTKISRFGEVRVKSPPPPTAPPSAPPPMGAAQQMSRINGHGNGNGNGNGNYGGKNPNEIDFLSLLEKEEADFAEQIKKQKAFLQSVFKDKEDLAQACFSQTAKLSKLESERMEWQRKIIEAEREKRDYLERLDQEQQSHRQSVKKLEKMKRDYDKSQADFGILAKERNEAISQLSKELKEIERLENERKDLFNRIDTFERQKTEKKETSNVTKNLGDLNMKLKMEIGQLRSENDKLSKANTELTKEKGEVGDKLVGTKASLRDHEAEMKSIKSKLTESTESCTNLKNLLEATQAELKRAKDSEMEAKITVTKTRKEMVTMNLLVYQN